MAKNLVGVEWRYELKDDRLALIPTYSQSGHKSVGTPLYGDDISKFIKTPEFVVFDKAPDAKSKIKYTCPYVKGKTFEGIELDYNKRGRNLICTPLFKGKTSNPTVSSDGSAASAEEQINKGRPITSFPQIGALTRIVEAKKRKTFDNLIASKDGIKLTKSMFNSNGLLIHDDIVGDLKMAFENPDSPKRIKAELTESDKRRLKLSPETVSSLKGRRSLYLIAIGALVLAAGVVTGTLFMKDFLPKKDDNKNDDKPKKKIEQFEPGSIEEPVSLTNDKGETVTFEEAAEEVAEEAKSAEEARPSTLGIVKDLSRTANSNSSHWLWGTVPVSNVESATNDDEYMLSVIQGIDGNYRVNGNFNDLTTEYVKYLCFGSSTFGNATVESYAELNDDAKRQVLDLADNALANAGPDFWCNIDFNGGSYIITSNSFSEAIANEYAAVVQVYGGK